GVGAVEPVVRRHYRLCAALFYGNFKGGEIYFAQGTLVHHTVYNHAPELLVVGGKVLYAGVDPALLNTPYARSRHFTGEVRVLRIILKVSAAQRVALYV